MHSCDVLCKNESKEQVDGWVRIRVEESEVARTLAPLSSTQLAASWVNELIEEVDLILQSRREHWKRVHGQHGLFIYSDCHRSWILPFYCSIVTMEVQIRYVPGK